ncbi:MAG: DNRLRE domain-containing protein [Promethearchaeota archaeon]
MNNRIKTIVKIAIFIIFAIVVIVGVTIGLHNAGYSKYLRVRKDTYVSEQFPDTNYGAEEYVRVGNYSNYGEVQAFYYFDVSSLPTDWTEVRIEVKFEYGSGEVHIGANLTYESWDEMTITWNNKPTESVYRGHIYCDGFDFGIPLPPEQIIDGGIGVILYVIGGETNDYIQGSTKEGSPNAIIELHYIGISPTVIFVFSIITPIVGLFFGSTMRLVLKAPKKYKRTNNDFRADWRNVNINPINRQRRVRELGEIEERLRNFNQRINQERERRLEEIEEMRRNLDRWRNPNIPNMPSYMRSTPAQFEKKINDYITLRFENYRIIIYVAERRIIQCVHLILNIPKNEVSMYDEIDSIDEAADKYRKEGLDFRHVGLGSGKITPEQEFWGHCSNIQAWVEHDYDTRILMSNLAFPLLRELTRAGDPVAKRVYKEEVARRLESGYPSVVQYLLDQGYIGVFTPSEFESILEATDIIVNLSFYPSMLNQFVRSCFRKFPTLIENILLQILNLNDGKKIIFSIIQKSFIVTPFRAKTRDLDFQFLQILDTKFKVLLKKVEEDDIKKDISDCIKLINATCQENDRDPPSYRESIFFREPQGGILNFAGVERGNRDQLRARAIDNLRALEELRDGREIRLQVHRHQARCSYCGRIIPRNQDICEWCGHRRDDDNEFFPYPFIFRDPDGGGGGSMKGEIAIPIKVKT